MEAFPYILRLWAIHWFNVMLGYNIKICTKFTEVFHVKSYGDFFSSERYELFFKMDI